MKVAPVLRLDLVTDQLILLEELYKLGYTYWGHRSDIDRAKAKWSIVCSRVNGTSAYPNMTINDKDITSYGDEYDIDHKTIRMNSIPHFLSFLRCADRSS